MRGFLYGQTEYNILSNTNRLDEYIEMAKNSSFDFLTITDSNLYGSYKFYNKCKAKDIKPIIGLEYSYTTEDQNKSIVLLYPKNKDGYKNLLKITSRVKLEHIERISDLEEFKDNMMFVFIFNDSFLERMLYSREFNMLDEYLNMIKEYDGYIGISYTNKLAKIDINKRMEEYANTRGIKTIPVHQCKYLTYQDTIIYESLRKIAGYDERVNEFDDYSFNTNPLEDARIDEFISKIDLDLFKDEIELPKYPNTKGASSKEYLQALCYKGLQKRGFYYQNYVDRLAYELSVIDKMGYNDYFLIVWDFIRYAKMNNILVGPGRGSAAGSLVAFCLGITEVNPIEYDLLFERFLNPERVTMPDIDTDFPDIERDKVIDHVKNLYGNMHVCNISAFGTFQIKSSVRELSKVFKIEASRIDKIVDMVLKIGYDDLLIEYKDNPLYDFLYVCRGLEGLPKHISTHAAGIILSSLSLDDIIPLQEGINGLHQSQLEASDLESIGLLKMDFLGIRNLTMIEGMMSQIPGFDFNALRKIPLNDPKVYKLLQEADTLGLFQLESNGIRNVLRKLKPSCFEDLVAVLALYRPGPMDNIDEFIRRKHGERFNYIHNDLIPILKNTYGIIVYQEQIMKIAQVFAGYSLGEADMLRRAVSKKKASVLEKMSTDFINRSIKKGYSKDVAVAIYELIYKFANYGFNKSHSVAYAMLTYQMAYFKVNYFPIFMANILNNVIGSNEAMISYIKYAKAHGLVTLKPNINISTTKFVFLKNRLFIPLNSIYSIGDVAAREIIKERSENGIFKDYYDFKRRCSFLSSSNITALVYAGALDIFAKTKKSMTNSISKEDELFLKYMTDKVEIDDEYDLEYLREMELKYLGINLEYNIYKNANNIYMHNRINTIASAKVDDKVNYLIEFTSYKAIKTKKGDVMLLGQIADEAGSLLNFVIFPKTYQSLKVEIKRNRLYLVNGVINKDRDDKIQIIINFINDVN